MIAKANDGGTVRAAMGWLKRRAENISAAMLAAMFFAFIIQVFFRYGLNWPVGWTTEVCTITWLWGILWGSAFVLKDSEEIRFDIVYAAVPSKVRCVFRAISGVVIVILYVIAFPATVSYVMYMKVEAASYTDVRFDYLFSIYIIFVCATIVRYGWIAWRALHGDPGVLNSGVGGRG